MEITTEELMKKIYVLCKENGYDIFKLEKVYFRNKPFYCSYVFDKDGNATLKSSIIDCTDKDFGRIF